jgi:glycosyltransferase involved in cell wall biosynthesis
VGAEVSVVIPIFNEARVLPATLEQLALRFHSTATEIFLVDDGSTDDSAGLAEHLVRDLPQFEVLRLPVNMGKGAALRAGIARTTSACVIFMDADLSTSLDGLDSVINGLDDYDIVIGSRSIPGSVVKRSSPLRTAMGRTFNRLMRWSTGLPVHDSQCGFKAFRGDVARLLFSLSTCDRFAFDPEILRLGTALGYTVKEVPVLWVAGDHSAVRPIRDSVRTAVDLIPIRARTRAKRIRDLASRSSLPVPPPAANPFDHHRHG